MTGPRGFVPTSLKSTPGGELPLLPILNATYRLAAYTTVDIADLVPYIEDVGRRVARKVPEQDCDDVVQEIFLSAVRNVETFRQSSSLRTWLITIANRRIADYYRKRERNSRLFSLSPTPFEVNNPWSETDRRIEVELIKPRLSEMDRQTLDDYGLPYKEILDRYGISYEALRSRRRRLVEHAKEILQ